MVIGPGAVGRQRLLPRAVPPKRASLRFVPWSLRSCRGLAFIVGATLCGCSRTHGGGTHDAGPDAARELPLARDLAAAEDTRAAERVEGSHLHHHDVQVRRRAAQALARIQSKEGSARLLETLSDEDSDVVAWSAFGLGQTCKGREDATVRALVARAISMVHAPSPRDALLDARSAIARAVGRCGGAHAEASLRAWTQHAGLRAHAFLGLGDLATRRRALDDETWTTLVDAVLPDAPDGDGALYAMSRIDAPPSFRERVELAAKRAMTRNSDHRIFAVRALGRTGKGAAAELSTIVTDTRFRHEERAEAARGLFVMRDDAREQAAEALTQLAANVTERLADPREHAILLTLLQAMAPSPPKRALPALYKLLQAEATAPRVFALRCAAASALGKGDLSADVLDKCAPHDTEAYESARLAMALRGPLTGARRSEWQKLAETAHIRVREEAMEAIGAHPELGGGARAVLVTALGSGKPGLVATAAQIVSAHPDRVLVVSRKEREAALDPNAPPPSNEPAMDLDPEVLTALTRASTHAWREDLIETRALVLDALVATRHPSARKLADAACHDANVTMRERGIKALKALGEQDPVCPPPKEMPLASELEHLRTQPIELTWSIGDRKLKMTLDPALAPVTVTRLGELAKSGFYRGIVVHRVAPGFVVQFGDPDGDGYGGNGQLLRCETSPVPFGKHAVGIALAGRDTGSSQLFVTLSTTPHLDGEYTYIGHAEGDWDAIVAGDVVQDVKVDN